MAVDGITQTVVAARRMSPLGPGSCGVRDVSGRRNARRHNSALRRAAEEVGKRRGGLPIALLSPTPDHEPHEHGGSALDTRPSKIEHPNHPAHMQPLQPDHGQGASASTSRTVKREEKALIRLWAAAMFFTTTEFSTVADRSVHRREILSRSRVRQPTGRLRRHQAASDRRWRSARARV
jgi:hypothetical protein